MVKPGQILPMILAIAIVCSGFVINSNVLTINQTNVNIQQVGGITNITATPDYCFKGVYCIGDLLAEREGYARSATGGLGGYVYFVTSLEDDPTNPKPGTLRHALTQTQPLWIFFLVNGTINLKARIDVRAHKTIDGRGAQITISAMYADASTVAALVIRDNDNIIITNIRFDLTDTRNIDAIEIRRSNNIWIHRCDFTNFADGAVDIAEASTTRTNNITISWSRFWNQDKIILIGNSAGRSTDRNFRVTLHHNYFFMTQDRHPRLRFGIVDMYNNYLYWVGEASGISQRGIVYAEANIYELVPGDTEIADCTWSAESPGYFFNVSNWFIKPPGANAIIDGCWTNTTYVRPYPANVEPANEELKRKIMMYAGTDFPLLPRLMIDHPNVQWGEFEWDLPLPTSIPRLAASFVIDVTPYKSPEDEVVEMEWYMGDGTKYTGTPLDFLNRTTSDLRVRHTYPAPGIYTITVLMKTAGGSTLLVSNVVYANMSMIQTVTATLVYTTTTTTTYTTTTIETVTMTYTVTPVPLHRGIMLLVRGLDGSIYYGTLVNNTIVWNNLDGYTDDKPSGAVYGGKVYVFVRGGDNGVWYGFIDLSSFVFSGWMKLPGSTSSRPSVASTPYGVVVVVRGMDNGIYLGLVKENNFSGWYSVPGKTVDTPAVTFDGNLLHVIVKGEDGNLYHTTIDPTTYTQTTEWTIVPEHLEKVYFEYFGD